MNGGAFIRDAAQHYLPMFETEPQAAVPSVWFLSAAGEDAAAIRRSCGPAGRSTSFLFLDLENGDTPISPSDLIVLKTTERSGLDLFAPKALHDASGTTRLVDAVRKLLILGPELSQPRKTVDLGMVRFGGNALRSRRKGWSRTEIEKILDALLCTEIASDPVLLHRLSDELVREVSSEGPSLLRAIALRLRADAISAIGADAAAVIAAYAEAREELHGAGAGRQAVAAGRLERRAYRPSAGRQIELWPVGEDDGPSHVSFGFHLRRFSGMKLPTSAGWLRNSTVARGMLGHKFVASFGVEDLSLAAWIAGANVSTSMASAHPVAMTPGSESIQTVDFVIDSELATRAGLAGKVGGASAQELRYRLMPRSETCRMSPTMADTGFGRPARFRIEGPPSQRTHWVDLIVLTSDAAQTSIPLLVRPALQSSSTLPS